VIAHPRTWLEQLDPAQVEDVRRASLRILDGTGLAITLPEAVHALADAGARVDGGRVRLGPELVERLVERAPRRFTLHGRTPARSVEVGGGALLVSPGYGSPSVADTAGRRRDATMADFERFAALAGASDAIDITGGLLVEPLDVPPALRPLEITRSLLERSDKPFLGSVAGAAGARESLDIARVVFGAGSVDFYGRAVMMGLVNINSPLRLDDRMAEALVEYARAGQAVLLTPGILMGVTAPVTASGALVQAVAELLGCAALVQAVRPGSPVVIGTGGFGADLRTGGPGFGRPENALGTVLGAQVARRIGLPFRCSGMVTGSRVPDNRSGYERMMTAMAAWTAGAHVCLQGAGTLDSINSMSYEQFAIDVEIWAYLKRLAARPSTDAGALAVDVIAALPVDYLGVEHTMEHLAAEMAAVSLATPKSYDEWLADGAPDVVGLAGKRLAALDGAGGVQPLDERARRDLDHHVRERRRQLGGQPTKGTSAVRSFG
jgi:trimethylamine--corrinoid protein Co-methyltransferase